MAGPLTGIRFIHSAIRNDLKGMKQEISVVASLGAGDLKQTAERFAFWESVLGGHEQAEEQVLFPAIDAKVPGTSQPYEQQHREMDGLREQLRGALAGSNAERAYNVVGEMVTKMDAHLDKEENELIPLCDQHLTPQEQQELGGQMSTRTPQEVMAAALPWMFRLQGQEEREGFIRMMMGMMPAPAFQGVKAAAKGAVPEQDWQDLTRRVPELAG